MQHWTKVKHYSLPGLAWYIKLRVGISHVSISGISNLSTYVIMVHGRGYIFHCFHFLLFFVTVCCLIFVFCFCYLLTVVWATENRFYLTLLLYFWLIFKLHYYYFYFITTLCYIVLYYNILYCIILYCIILYYIIIYYITKLHYSRSYFFI